MTLRTQGSEIDLRVWLKMISATITRLVLPFEVYHLGGIADLLCTEHQGQLRGHSPILLRMRQGPLAGFSPKAGDLP